MKKTDFIKIPIFLCLCLLIYLGASRILASKWSAAGQEGASARDFYQLEDNSVDVLVLGNSQVVYGVSSYEMYEAQGISAYCLGMSSAPMFGNFYWLQEALKTQDIKSVLLDVSSLYETDGEAAYRRVMDNMKLSWNKIQAVMELDAPTVLGIKDGRMSYLFNFIKYHSRWSELTKEDFAVGEIQDRAYAGMSVGASVNSPRLDMLKFSLEDPDYSDWDMIPTQKNYFIRLIEFCKEKGIDLTLIKTPKESWTHKRYPTVKAIADEYGLDYLDFNQDEMIDQLNLDYDHDFKDHDHLNIRGAEKFSDYLANYLSEKLDLPDHRSEGLDTQNYQDYKIAVEDAYLATEYDIPTLVSELGRDRYDVVIRMSEDISQHWTEELQQAFTDIGITTDFRSLYEKNYVAQLNAGSVIAEQITERIIKYDGALSDGSVVRAEAYIGQDHGLLTFTADLPVDYTEEATLTAAEGIHFSKSGINIMVYDYEYQHLVDLLTIYYDDADGTFKVQHD